ncbi:MAG: M64 family metallopeptidase [Phycisphaerae bacterium]|nr:M64 family metallopeptidase [Phycisphaerae bacterium]
MPQLEHAAALFVLAAVIAASDSARADEAPPQRGKTLIYGCFPGPDGVLVGGPRFIDASPPAALSFVQLPFATLLMNGPVSNRVDIVFVGDGFQSGELAAYATVVNQRWSALSLNDPYVSYLPYFNAHRVDVTSQESGVDNDPTPGILKNTALDSGFWCQGIERLLCANTFKTKDAANSAPDWDQILLLANSSKYGGAGYPTEDICTFSAFEFSSLQIALHELGHAFGNLADEYDYADGATYSGPEVPEGNVSILTQSAMESSGTKWAPWLGFSVPGVGVHGAFEGARYFQFGIRRPTSNSLMRSLGLPFNGPSLEGMIVEIHKATIMLDATSHATGTTVAQGELISVTALEPASHTLAKQWHLDGVPIPGSTGTSIATGTLGIPPEGAELKLVIIDPTTKVKNEALRTQWLRESYTWTIVPATCIADLDGSGTVDSSDLSILLGGWGSVAGDLDQSGTTDAQDLSILLAAWGTC